MELDLKSLKISASDSEATLQPVGRTICQVGAKYITALPQTMRLVITVIYLASDDSFTRLMYIYVQDFETVSFSLRSRSV
jgi:hypothetical protein